MIVTYTGKYFDFDNIGKESIDILDITHALSRINRFVGHCSRSYSVGEHTVHGLVMARKMGYTPIQQLHWLIHDFTEAYVGDCPSPLKAILPEYQRIEAEVLKAIYDFVGLPPMTEEEQQLVHKIDKTMLLLEMRDLTLHNHLQHIHGDIHAEILSDPDFHLFEKRYNAEVITMILRKQYEGLIKEVM